MKKKKDMVERNEVLAKKLYRISYVISGIVLILVGLMRRIKIDTDIDFSFLPPVHASLNTLVAVFLLLALYFIKQGNIALHRKMIYGAMTCSALFLLCYVTYHFTTEETKYCGLGTMRKVYFFFLLSHILLAGLSLPFILINFINGYCGLIEKHKKMSKWIYPIWLYVAITGPLCYFLLYPCYHH